MKIAVIPARGGSRRIPRKNIRSFHGKPLIAYSIDTARRSALFDSIFVSTDDDEIAEVATRYGAKALMREAAYARDEVGTQEVMGYVLRQIGLSLPSNDMACCLYATTPLLEPQDLITGFTLLWARPAAYVVAVCANPLCDAGAFYFGMVDSFLSKQPLYTTSTALYPLPQARVCDINEPADWDLAERMYAALEREEEMV